MKTYCYAVAVLLSLKSLLYYILLGVQARSAETLL